MKSAVVAAIVAALVAAGASSATIWINGRQIRPHSIPLNRLAHRPVGLPGPTGPAGPAGPQGEQGAGGAPGPQGMSIFAYPNPNDPGRCVDVYQEVHQYVDLQVLVDTICAPK